MVTISLCMIVKNEERTLSKCLNSVRSVVDEIIIVDTGSKDNTKKVAARYTDKIFDFKWNDNFADARNFSFSKATMEYILWLDADDVILKKDIIKFFKLKKTLNSAIDSVTMKYNIGFDMWGNVLVTFRRNRLVKRINKFKWYGRVHEYLDVQGNIKHSDICIIHNAQKKISNRNLNIYKSMLKEGIEFTPRDVYYFGNELYDHEFYEEALEEYRKFLNMDGWIEDKLNVYCRISDYYNLIGNIDKAKEWCYKALNCGIIKTEFCCRLGYCCERENNIVEAIYWYKVATMLKANDLNAGFNFIMYQTWLPHLRLYICFMLMGKHSSAQKHLRIAKKYGVKIVK